MENRHSKGKASLKVYSNHSKKNLQGPALLQEVVHSTGLPAELISTELVEILDDARVDQTQLSLENLRAAMLLYLEAVMGEQPSNDQKDPKDPKDQKISTYVSKRVM